MSRLRISIVVAWRAGHALGDLGQIEVVVAARRRGHADEHAPGEEGGGHLLQPQPRRADRAGDHVEEDRQREHRDADAAQHHQGRFDRVERLPLQMAVALQDQGAKVGHSGLRELRRGAGCGAGRQRTRDRRHDGADGYLTSRTSLSSLTACGPSSAASWSWIGCAALMKPDLSTSSTTFTPIALSLSAESFSSLQRQRRLLLAYLVGGGLHPPLLLGRQAVPGLVADPDAVVVGLVLGHRQDRRHFVVLVREVDVDAVLGDVDHAGLQRGVDVAERHVHRLRTVGREVACPRSWSPGRVPSCP